MSLALNGSAALQHFEHGNAVKIRNRLMFDFYLGLPHIKIFSSLVWGSPTYYAMLYWRYMVCITNDYSLPTMAGMSGTCGRICYIN